MTRRTIPLQQHLLTRSDLARMEILAAELLHWQAKGWLEQVGRLPDARSNGDPVFAVHAPDLRRDLASRLDAIGKPAVVMAPRQVRSLLLQALLPDAKTPHGRPSDAVEIDGGVTGERHAAASSNPEGGEVPGPRPDELPLPPTGTVEGTWDSDNAVATHLLDNDLAQVLQEATAEFETELESMHEVAGAEAAQQDESVDAAAPDVEDPFEADACFDADDLTAALTCWGGDEPESPAPNGPAAPTLLDVASEPPATVPEPEPLPGDPADVRPEVTAGEPSATTMMTETSTATGLEAEPLPAAGGPTTVETGPPESDVLLTQEIGPAIAVGSDALVPEPTPPPPPADEPATMPVSRVETFLGELKSAMVEMTQRPQPAVVDLRPLVEAVQSGFERSARQSAATNCAVLSLTERVSGIGQQVEHGVSRAVRDALDSTVAVLGKRVAPEPVASHEHLLPISLLAIPVLVLCWSVLLWFKTGSPNLALATLVGANVVACVLAARRPQA